MKKFKDYSEIIRCNLMCSLGTPWANLPLGATNDIRL